MKKKKSLRSTVKTRAYADCDYKDKLSDGENEWLTQFLREYYCRPSQSQIEIHPKEAGTSLRANDNARSTDIYLYNHMIIPPDLNQDFDSLLDNLSKDNPESILEGKQEVAALIKAKIKKRVR